LKNSKVNSNSKKDLNFVVESKLKAIDGKKNIVV
jgi:hypothetical protein